MKGTVTVNGVTTDYRSIELHDIEFCILEHDRLDAKAEAEWIVAEICKRENRKLGNKLRLIEFWNPKTWPDHPHHLAELVIRNGVPSWHVPPYYVEDYLKAFGNKQPTGSTA
ncbi:MAG: hypothetical protein LC540_17520 [Candidatus Thiodiazotropha sp.]|nr:hypothetical protein [Candidatus Thiodiazotropha sp.]